MPRTYLYLGIDTPTDDKLIARPLVERHLWTCLLCLAKRSQYETGNPAIRGHDAKVLAARFNLGSTKQVQAGLNYFSATKPRALISVDAEGSIHITNFIEWQGVYDAEAEREKWRARQEKSRVSRRDRRDKSRDVTGNVTGVTPAIAVAVASEASKHVVSSRGGVRGGEPTACESVDNSTIDAANIPETDKIQLRALLKSGRFAEATAFFSSLQAAAEEQEKTRLPEATG